MDHRTALRLRAGERYRSHELTPAERDAFEEHFFECPDCAAWVLFEQSFVANTRAALREVNAPDSDDSLRDGLRLNE